MPALLWTILLMTIVPILNSCSSCGSYRSNKDFFIPDIISNSKPNIEGTWHRVIAEDASEYLNNDGDDTFDGEMTGEETYTFNDDGSFSQCVEAKVDARGILKTNEAFFDLIMMSRPMEMTFTFNIETTGNYTYDAEAETLLLTQTEIEIHSVIFNTNYGFVNALLKENAERMMEKRMYNLFQNGKTYDYEITICTEKQLGLQDETENAKYVRVTY